MTLEEKDRQNLIGYRLQQAKETMDDVQLLINNKRFRSAVNRIYYGMFYALLALGSANRFETSKHAQLIGWFNRNFIYEGKIDARFGRIINKAFNRRTKGDYDTFVEFEEEIVIEMYAEMNDFIDEIESYIRKN
jgi:uncharacterized protein (UPF0332 family)